MPSSRVVVWKLTSENMVSDFLTALRLLQTRRLISGVGPFPLLP